MSPLWMARSVNGRTNARPHDGYRFAPPILHELMGMRTSSCAERKAVGWVERSDTHRLRRTKMMVIAALHLSYTSSAPGLFRSAALRYPKVRDGKTSTTF